MAEYSPDIIVLVDKDLRIQFINRRVSEGPVAEVIGSSAVNFIPPEFQPTMIRCCRRVWETSEPDRYYTEYHNPSTGEVRHFEARVGPITKSGEVVNLIINARDITEMKAQENALRESEARWRSLVEQAPDLIMMVDQHGILLFVNRSVTGRPIDQALGKTLYDYTPPKYHDLQREAIKRVFESGEQSSYDVEGPGPDGTTLWFRTRIGPVIQEGQIVAAILTTRDVTARKLMEKALQVSESNHRTLIEHTLHGIGILQGEPGNTRMVFANPALTQITGYSAEEITSFSFTELASIIIEEDRLKFGKAFWDHVQGHTGPPRCEVRVIHKDKSIIWTDVTGTPFEYEGQTSWLVTFVDITDLKQAEATLQAREQQLQVLADNIPGIVYRLHLEGEGRREFLNDQLEQITGYTEEELPGGMCCLEPIIHTKDQARVKATMKQALENRTAFEVQYRIKHKDGRTRILHERGQAVKDDSGEPCFLDGVILDQTPTPERIQ